MTRRWIQLYLSAATVLALAFDAAAAPPPSLAAHGDKPWEAGALAGAKLTVKTGTKVRLLGESITCGGGVVAAGTDIVVSKSMKCQVGSATLELEAKNAGDQPIAIFALPDGFYLAQERKTPLVVAAGTKVTLYGSTTSCADDAGRSITPAGRSFAIERKFEHQCKVDSATLRIQVDDPAPPTAPSAPQAPAASAVVAAAASCTASQLRPADVPGECKSSKAQGADDGDRDAVICIGLDGGLIGAVPELEEGQVAVVRLVAPQIGAVAGLGVSFERELFLTVVGKQRTQTDSGAVVLAERRVKLRTAGKLDIRVQTSGGEMAATGGACSVPTAEHQQTLQVLGNFYLTVGLAPIYSTRRTLEAKTSLGADGIHRLVENVDSSLDLAVNLVVYPWGIRDTTTFSVGMFLGTSLVTPGRSWYLGLNPSFPVAGVGLTGGVGAHIVQGLAADREVGQPWPAGVDVPTQTTAQLGWYAGVNLEDGLFRKVFGAVVDDD
jgi:hypothetical protein